MDCKGTCSEKETFNEYQGTPDKETCSGDYKPMVINIATNEPIPHTLTQSMKETYNTQLNEGLNLPENLCPSEEFCPKGFKFTLPDYLSCPVREVIIVYTETDVISLPHHKGTLFI